MAQVDWLFEMLPSLEQDDILRLVTTGNIDSVVLHIYAVSRNWPRNDHGKFLHSVYVVLEKTKGKLDVYNIYNKSL